MYSNYSMYPAYQNMYRNNNFSPRNRNDRFFGGGLVAPLLLGGIAGYALGRPNNCCGGYYQYPAPVPYYPYPNYYNTNYYY